MRRTVTLLAAGLFLAAVAPMFHGTVEAQSHTATRSFSAELVEPGGHLEVSVSAEGYGAIGQVVETLPDGFAYLDSDLPDAAVSLEGQTVAFTLFQSSRFTYLVSAPEGEDLYSFSGIIKDQVRRERPVTGDSIVRVGPLPLQPAPERTPTATSGSTPRAEPAARPTQTGTSTPAPTVVPASPPTAAPAETPIPAPTVEPAAGSTPVITATAEAAATTRPAPTRGPTATPEPTREPTPPAGLATGSSGVGGTTPPTPAPSASTDGLPTWVMAAIAAGAAALFIGALAVALVLARRRRERHGGGSVGSPTRGV